MKNNYLNDDDDNLLEEIKAGSFREDLYHRLNEFSFHIPSLNERKEDIGLTELFRIITKTKLGGIT